MIHLYHLSLASLNKRQLHKQLHQHQHHQLDHLNQLCLDNNNQHQKDLLQLQHPLYEHKLPRTLPVEQLGDRTSNITGNITETRPREPSSTPGVTVVKGLTNDQRTRLVTAAEKTVSDIEKALRDANKTLADLKAMPLEENISKLKPPSNIYPKQYTIGFILPANTEFAKLPQEGISPESYFADLVGNTMPRPLQLSSIEGQTGQNIAVVNEPPQGPPPRPAAAPAAAAPARPAAAPAAAPPPRPAAAPAAAPPPRPTAAPAAAPPTTTNTNIFFYTS